MSDDIVIRLRRAYDETGNSLIGDALNEIVRLRGAPAQPSPLGEAVRKARGGDAPPAPMKGYA